MMNPLKTAKGMLPPRWEKVLVDLWENRARTLLVVASIYIGVFAVGMIAVSYIILPRGMERTYVNAVPANIEIVTTAFDQELLDSVGRLAAVGQVEGRRVVPVQARVMGSPDWMDVDLSASQDLSHQQVKKLALIHGSFSQDKHSILLMRNTLTELDGEVGDTLEVKLQDGTIRTLRITGAAKDYTLDLAGTLHPNHGYISRDTLEYLHADNSFNTLYATVTDDSNDEGRLQEVANQVRKQVENSGRPVTRVSTSPTNKHPYGNYIRAVISILGLLGAFTVVLSASLISNTMNALMAQHIRQIGVMKLVGADRRQVTGMYLTLVTVLGLTSLVFAIPTGAFAGYRISAMSADALNGELIEPTRMPIVPAAVLLQLVVAVAIPLAAAMVPVLRGSGVSVQQALSGSLIRAGGKASRFDRWLDRRRQSTGITLLALRNTFRNKTRLLVTLFTFALGGAIFISVFNVQLALNQQVKRISNYSSADVFVETTYLYPERKVRQLLETIPGVDRVEAWKTASAKINLENEQEIWVRLTAPPDDTLIVDPITQAGRWVTPQDRNAVVVNEAFWNIFPDLKPGDQIRMELAGREETWTVVGIFHYTGMDQKVAYTNQATLNQILRTRSHTRSYRVITERHDPRFQTEMTQRVNQVLLDEGIKLTSITSLHQLIKDPVEKMDIIIFSLLILAVLTGIVGSIGLSGTLSLNVMERTSEIGILRAIGAHNRVIIRLVMVEGLIIGLVSYATGALLSLPITKALGDVVIQAIFKAPGKFVLTPKGFGLWFAIVLVLSILASMVPARSATSMTIREVLAYE